LAAAADGFGASLVMASVTPSQRLANQPLIGNRARVLLVNKDLQDLGYYRQILQKLGCQVRTSSSFAEGVHCLGCELFDLIILDQGCDRFEGRDVLARAMEIDVDLRVLVLARAYARDCYLEAMQSGALDYHEGPLRAEEIVALLDTFVPRRNAVDPRKRRSKGGGYG